MRICNACKRLDIQRLPPTTSPAPKGFRLSNLAHIHEHADTCDFCNVIKTFLMTKQRFGTYFDANGPVDGAAELELELRRPPKDGRASKTATKLTGLDISIGGSEALVFRIELYALKNSPPSLSGDVVEKDLNMALDPLSPKPADLVKKWLGFCTASHDKCRRSFIGHDIDRTPEGDKAGVAPRRLLHIQHLKSPENVLSVRLMEVDLGFSADYVALSHCWGPREKQPLRTLRANLQTHQAEIPWSSLPQTFRDACTLCSELGVRYLWIDSLCIVQDDDLDWRTEAAIMGRIYEESLFTIAASSALDSTQGLFAVRRKDDFAELPYYQDIEVVKPGCLYAYIGRSGPGLTISKSPLNTRAWVMQEYVLSRRTVHFTEDGVIWTCSRDPAWCRNEYGIEGSHIIPNAWDAMVREYTQRSMTFKSDKLIALQGLAESWARCYSKTYYCGIFLEDLPNAFRWVWNQTGERLVRDVGCDIPTWSWASTTGNISFEYIDDPTATKPVCQDIVPSAVAAAGGGGVMPGALKLTSFVKAVPAIRGPFECLPVYIEDLRKIDPDPDLLRIDEEWCNHNNHSEPKLLLMDDSEHNIGWGALDEALALEGLGRVSCVAIATQPVRPWYMPPTGTAEPLFVWCLLVVPKDGCSDVYLRVGYARVLVPSWLETDQKRDIYLV